MQNLKQVIMIFLKRLLGVAGICILFFTLVQCKQEKQDNRPNLLIVFPDQMRGHAMGFVGKEPVLTPNLDTFAKEGIYFSQAVSNYPICSPYRAMLMTGKYPHSTHMISNCNSKSGEFGVELDAKEECWSDVLNNQGYSLGYIGKWHLDTPHKPYVNTSNNRPDFAWNEWAPPSRRHGFSYWHAYGTYDYHLRPMYWNTDTPRDSFFYVDQWGPEHEADKAISFIKNENNEFREKGKPFALVVSMNPPHTGYSLVPDRYKELYRDIPIDSLVKKPNIPPAGTKWGDHYRKHIKDYYAAVTGVDEQFGRILKALKEQDLEDNTIVVFTSDHGDCIGTHEFVTKNNYFEEAFNIPLIIRYPQKLEPRTDELLLSVPDLYPTFLELMGMENLIPDEVEGISYAQYLLSGEGETPSSQLYMKVPLGEPTKGDRGVRNKRYTYIVQKLEDDRTDVVLFDRQIDPYQLNNIAKENRKLVDELNSELLQWLNKTDDPWLVK